MIDKLKAKSRIQVGSSGFTLIEIVIVLAIAGLIFLVVFQAVGNTQQARRDSERRSHVGQIAAALEQYAGNHNGTYPANSGGTFTNFTDNYLSDLGLNDPLTGTSYNFTGGAVGSATPMDVGQINYSRARVCHSNGTQMAGGTARQYALIVQLESGRYCVDNR